MKTPIADFVREYSALGVARLHMPGHKGKPLLGPEAHDITEIEGADVLYSPTGIILESERLAAELFGSARTVYSTEGSSLSIKAMLALAVMHAKEKGERALVLAARNAHKAFINAAALLDFDVEWIAGDSLITAEITPDALRGRLISYDRPPTAVYITSPDYLGNVADIGRIAEVCHEMGVPLLVDNAHGAYLRFLPEDIHPMTLGADMCCDSAHKTLPTLTGGAYLHVSKNAPEVFRERADEAMTLFASTSPSYLILESIDLTNAYLADGYKKRLTEFLSSVDGCKRRISAAGHVISGSEPLKITLKTKEYGYMGRDFAENLKRYGYFVEFADADFVTMMLSPEFSADEMCRLTDAILSIPRRDPIAELPPPPPACERRMSVREAMLAPSETLPIGECVGRILSSAAVSCPPAVPVLISGEVVTDEAVEALRYYGVAEIRVVK